MTAFALTSSSLASSLILILTIPALCSLFPHSGAFRHYLFMFTFVFYSFLTAKAQAGMPALLLFFIFFRFCLRRFFRFCRRGFRSGSLQGVGIALFCFRKLFDGFGDHGSRP